MARKILRQIETFTPVAGETGVRRRMPLGMTLAAYHLRLTGTLTVGVAAATILEDSPFGFIRSMQVMLNNSFPLSGDGMHGRIYFFLNRYQRGTSPRVTAPLAAVGASNFVAEWSHYFGQPDLVPPLDSAFWLDSRLLANLELVFNFGQAADVATAGGGGTVALSNLALTIWAEEVADVGGPTSRMQINRLANAVSATGQQSFPTQGLPSLGPAYRAVALHFTSGNADPIRATSDDTILTDATLIGDNIVRHVDAARYESIRGDNKLTRSLETMPAGWAVLDFARSATLRDIILTARTRNLQLLLNIGAAPANTFVEIVPLTPLLAVRARR